MPRTSSKSAPLTSFLEIPKQEERTPVEKSIKLDADIHDYIEKLADGKGSFDYIVNSILKQYRSIVGLPSRFAPQDGKTQPINHGKSSPQKAGMNA